MTKISVLVPFGATPDAAGAHRAAVWAYCSRKWERLRDLGAVDEIVVGKDPLFGKPRPTSSFGGAHPGTHPFSVARALNAAAERAIGEHFLLFGADHIPDMAAIAWAGHQLRGYAFARIYERVAYASEAATRIVLSNLSFPLDATDWNEVSAPCPGVLGVRRSAWDKAGGLDERFGSDWGWEDQDFLTALERTHQNGLRGTMGPSGYVLRELWHEDSRRKVYGTRNHALYQSKWETP